MNGLSRLVLVLFFVGLGWCSKAHAYPPYCTLVGGSTVGCFLAPVSYHNDALGSWEFDSFVDFAQAAAAKAVEPGTPCPQCTYGLLTEPLHVPAGARCSGYNDYYSQACQGKIYTHLDDPKTRNPSGVVVWGLAYDPPASGTTTPIPHYYTYSWGNAGRRYAWPDGTAP